MTLMGYQDNMEPNDAVRIGFSVIVFVVPAVCFLLSMAPMALYRLKPAQLESIRKELDSRRTAGK